MCIERMLRVFLEATFTYLRVTFQNSSLRCILQAKYHLLLIFYFSLNQAINNLTIFPAIIKTRKNRE